MNTAEKYAEEILQGIEKGFGKYIVKPPYQKWFLDEGLADYIVVKQSNNNRIEVALDRDGFGSVTAKIEGLESLSREEIEEILVLVEQKIGEMFFNEVHFGKFQYELTTILNFRHASKEFYLVNEPRKIELKERFDRYVRETTIDGSRKVIENEWISFLDKLFDTNLTQYTESQIIAVAEKYMESIETMGDKKFLKEYRSSLIHRAGKWKKAMFMPLYYQVKGNEKWDKEYILKVEIAPEKVDTDKLNLYIQQALWKIKYKQYSWDVKFACEDLDRAANELGSEKAKQYLKKGTGELPDNLIHYKDSELEANANDVFATISLKIKQETAEAYGKALDFITALLKAGFAHSYQIKLSSKAPKLFLDIKGLAKSSTQRFFAQALQYETLHPKLEKYAKVAMKEFEWYTDVEEGEKSCMPGSYAVFGLGLTSKKYFPLVIEYFKLVDDEHQMVHKHFVSALIERYGFSAETLPVIYEGVISSQDDVVFKPLTEAMQNAENKALLDDFLKDKEDYYQEAMYYAVYGKNWKKKK
jgi:hypothetical protein